MNTLTAEHEVGGTVVLLVLKFKFLIDNDNTSKYGKPCFKEN